MRRYINSLPLPLHAGKPEAATTSKNNGGHPDDAGRKWTLRTFDKAITTSLWPEKLYQSYGLGFEDCGD